MLEKTLELYKEGGNILTGQQQGRNSATYFLTKSCKKHAQKKLAHSNWIIKACYCGKLNMRACVESEDRSHLNWKWESNLWPSPSSSEEFLRGWTKYNLWEPTHWIQSSVFVPFKNMQLPFTWTQQHRPKRHSETSYTQHMGNRNKKKPHM